MRLSLASLFPALTAAVLMTAGPAAHADGVNDRRSITVSASGAVTVKPDIARINTGVTTEADTAREALSANSEIMEKVIAGLKESGIDRDDIQTSSLNVSPRYVRDKSGGPSQISGYQVTNQVQIVARDISDLGALLDKLVTLGANQIGGLSFDSSKADTLRDDARKDAVANARKRAELLATAADAELGEVLLVSEGGVDGPRPPQMARMMKAESVPIESGTQELTANVTVTWALK